jgi:hypothetical protein
MDAGIIEISGERTPTSVGRRLTIGTCRISFVIAAGLTMIVLDGRSQTSSQPDHPHSIILPEANRPLDPNDQMKLHERNAKKQNFEAANAERKRQLDDESAKLLILARDLKSQTDNLGTNPLPRKALREAEVIEVLAHDVKEKMKLTMGGS